MRPSPHLCLLVALCLLPSASASAQPTLAFPSHPADKARVQRASEWLARHIQRGTLSDAHRSIDVAIIAWKDPTLHADDPRALAGYAITDTLWASYALTLTEPALARELRDSLERLNCLSNGLHEVLWQPLNAIHHKPIDPDIVHGRSLGRMALGDATVDVRTFTMADDVDFTRGHPTLFAEHTVYQALHEFRRGHVQAARDRLRAIVDPAVRSDGLQVRWDHERALLIDYVNEADYQRFIASDSSSCRQYSFKLAALLYALRFMGLEDEYSLAAKSLQGRLADAQLPTGGVAHFFDVPADNAPIHPAPDATGEATALYLLSLVAHASSL